RAGMGPSSDGPRRPGPALRAVGPAPRVPLRSVLLPRRDDRAGIARPHRRPSRSLSGARDQPALLDPAGPGGPPYSPSADARTMKAVRRGAALVGLVLSALLAAPAAASAHPLGN